MPSATLAMALPTIEVVIRDGVPMHRVTFGGMSFDFADAWQARVRAHQFAATSGSPEPFEVDGDGGRFGEPGT